MTKEKTLERELREEFKKSKLMSDFQPYIGRVEQISDWWLAKIKQEQLSLIEGIEKWKEEFEEFFKTEYGYKGKHIEPDTSKKGHGTCCYCSNCGYDHDECVCESNRIHQVLNKLQTHLNSLKKDLE